MQLGKLEICMLELTGYQAAAIVSIMILFLSGSLPTIRVINFPTKIAETLHFVAESKNNGNTLAV